MPVTASCIGGEGEQGQPGGNGCTCAEAGRGKAPAAAACSPLPTLWQICPSLIQAKQAAGCLHINAPSLQWAQLPPPSAEASTQRGSQQQPPLAHRQQRDRATSRCIRSGWGHAGAKGRPRGAHSGRGHSTIGHKRRQLADRFIYICRPLPVRPCICAAGAAAAQAQQPTEALHCAERPPAARRWPTASAATARPASCSGGAAAGGCEGGAGRREGAEPGARCRVRARRWFSSAQRKVAAARPPLASWG